MNAGRQADGSMGIFAFASQDWSGRHLVETFVVYRDGKRVSETPTGRVFGSVKEAEREVGALNAKATR